MRAWSNLTFLISLQNIQWTNSVICFFWALLQAAKNLKFIKKYPCLTSLKTKSYWTQKKILPLIRKILMWIFWAMLWLSIPSTPIQPWGVIGAPLPCSFKNEILGSVPSIYTEVLELCNITQLSHICYTYFCCLTHLKQLNEPAYVRTMYKDQT